MGRGPSYPYVGLEEGIALSQKMYDYTKRAAAPVDSVIVDAWGYTVTSSSGLKVLAALKAFGLVEDAAAASGKAAIKLTPRAIRILLDDQDTTERRQEIRKAALSPKWYEYCWKTWGKEMPASMKSNLLIEHGFIDSTVEGFLKDYRKTIAFAGLLDPVIFSESEGKERKSDNDRPKVGDWVQFVLKGDWQFPESKKLLDIKSDAEHGEFGIVEGYLGGIPYKDLIKGDPPAEDAKPKFQPPNIFTPSFVPGFSPAITPSPRGETKMQVQTFSLPEGLVGQFQWPSEITHKTYAAFIRQLTDLKINVRDAVRPALTPEEIKSENETTAEKS